MVQYKVNKTSLTAVAEAIREKAGTSEALEFPAGFVEAINDIEGTAITVTLDNGVLSIE